MAKYHKGRRDYKSIKTHSSRWRRVSLLGCTVAESKGGGGLYKDYSSSGDGGCEGRQTAERQVSKEWVAE